MSDIESARQLLLGITILVSAAVITLLVAYGVDMYHRWQDHQKWVKGGKK